MLHDRIKHIEIDCHLIRDKVHEGSAVMRYVSNKQQLVDIFTKDLSTWLLKEHMIKMGAENIYSPF